MIRRDYILRMIEECMAALLRMRALRKDKRWNEADEELDSEFKKLIGDGAAGVARLSETDLLTRLMSEGPTHALRDKTFVLATLLTEAGVSATEQGRIDEGRDCFLKALHLLLDVLSREEVFECPEFVPKVELLREALNDAPLPMRTLAMLMQYYERAGEFAKAEDSLYAMLDADPGNRDIVDFGIKFYERVRHQSDAALENANLPRAEVEQGMRELQARR